MLVRISRDLIDCVDTKCRQFRHAEVNSLETPKEQISAMGKYLQGAPFYDAMWGEHLHLKDLIPQGWKSSYTAIILTLKGQYVSDNVTLNVAGYGPPNRGHSSYGRIEVPFDHPLLAHVRDTLMAWDEHYKTVKETDARWNNTRHEVQKFLNQQPSLNTALKIWPGVAHYIDQHYLDKVAEKKPKATVLRKKSDGDVPAEDKEEPTFDLEQLEAMGVIGKLMTGNKG